MADKFVISPDGGFPLCFKVVSGMTLWAEVRTMGLAEACKTHLEEEDKKRTEEQGPLPYE